MASLIPHLAMNPHHKVFHHLPAVCSSCWRHMLWRMPPSVMRSRSRWAAIIRLQHSNHGSRARCGLLVTTLTLSGARWATVRRMGSPGGFILGPRHFSSGLVRSFLFFCIFHHGFISCPHGGFPCLGSRSPQQWFIFPIPFFLNLPQPGDSCQHECKRHQIYQLRFSPTRKECCSTQDCQCPSKVAS